MKRIIALLFACLLVFPASAEEKKPTGWEAEVRAAVTQPSPSALPQPSLDKVLPQKVEPLPPPATVSSAPIAQTASGTQILECKPAPAPAAACPQPAPKVAAPPAAPLKIDVGLPCEGKYRLIVNAWNIRALDDDVAAKIRKLTEEETRYRSAAVSRTLGGQLRKENKGRVGDNYSGEVLLLNAKTLATEHRQSIQFSGRTEVFLSWGLTDGRIIELNVPSKFLSPPLDHDGIRRLRSFPNERGRCDTNIHAVVSEASAP